MRLTENKVAIIRPGATGGFLTLPEELNKLNTWFIGTNERAASFLEGLIVGIEFERTRHGRQEPQERRS
jgi:hypothetical protein